MMVVVMDVIRGANELQIYVSIKIIRVDKINDGVDLKRKSVYEKPVKLDRLFETRLRGMSKKISVLMIKL